MKFARFEIFAAVMPNVVEPEGEGSMILQTSGIARMPDDTTLHSRRRECS